MLAEGGEESLQAHREINELDVNDFVALFCGRLSKAIRKKTGDLKAQYDRTGILGICTIANSNWNCLDEGYCGHGLVERCMRWVPKEQEAFQPRVRAEVEQYLAKTVFSLDAGSDRADALKTLKQRRYAELKKITAEIVGQIAEDDSRRPAAMVDAHMLATPTLGKWPARFDREDVQVQMVALAGLLFAVDVCQGETRLMML